MNSFLICFFDLFFLCGCLDGINCSFRSHTPYSVPNHISGVLCEARRAWASFSYNDIISLPRQPPLNRILRPKSAAARGIGWVDPRAGAREPIGRLFVNATVTQHYSKSLCTGGVGWWRCEAEAIRRNMREDLFLMFCFFCFSAFSRCTPILHHARRVKE